MTAINRIMAVCLAGIVMSVLIGFAAKAQGQGDGGEDWCLYHTGPQDKPLPTLCSADGVGGFLSSEDDYIIIVPGIDLAMVKSFAGDPGETLCRGTYGAYALEGEDQVVICRNRMREFLHAVKQGADSNAMNGINHLLFRL